MFILATTELHKVPATILSRCQRFSFRRLTPGDIAGRMEDIARREQIDIEPDAVHLLSRLADGALRDGLSLLDQCASAVEGTITTESIAQTLGLAGTRQTARCCRPLRRMMPPVLWPSLMRSMRLGKTRLPCWTSCVPSPVISWF